MSSPSNAPVDLLDLKLLPAWVKESPEPGSYAQYEGEPDQERPRGQDRRTRERHDRRSLFAASARLGRYYWPNQIEHVRVLGFFPCPPLPGKAGTLRCSFESKRRLFTVSAGGKRDYFRRSPIPGKQCLPFCAAGVLQS